MTRLVNRQDNALLHVGLEPRLDDFQVISSGSHVAEGIFAPFIGIGFCLEAGSLTNQCQFSVGHNTPRWIHNRSPDGGVANLRSGRNSERAQPQAESKQDAQTKAFPSDFFYEHEFHLAVGLRSKIPNSHYLLAPPLTRKRFT